MTASHEPHVPHRVEVELEINASIEQVWQAIATADGISSWLMPTDLAAPDGGEIVFHMGPEHDSRGTVTAFEPPRRFAYAEDWAALSGQDPTGVTPLVTEFLVEARSGGTCHVRVVTSAFGSGAEWENEFFQEMADGWVPMLDNLRLYVESFPGQTATTMWVDAPSTSTPEALLDLVRDRLGVSTVGDAVTTRGVTASVERSIPRHVLLRTTEPVAGFLSFMGVGRPGECGVGLIGYLFGDDAAAYVTTEQSAWREWLGAIAAEATPTAPAPGRAS